MFDTVDKYELAYAEACYSVGDRKYHNFSHACNVLENAWKHPLCDMIDYHSLEVACLWHDAIYIPGSVRNEHLSSNMALMFNSARVEEALAIQATTHAVFPETSKDQSILSMILCDADLRSLSYPWEKYWASVENIRHEFIDWGGFTIDQWKEGREKCLVGFVNRPKIFWADEWELAYGERVRNNLRQELTYLSL